MVSEDEPPWVADRASTRGSCQDGGIRSPSQRIRIMRRFHRLIPSLCRPVWMLIGVCLLTAPRAEAQQQGPGGVIYSKQAGFRIPFDVPPGERRIQQVQLFVSEDSGRTWRQ